MPPKSLAESFDGFAPPLEQTYYSLGFACQLMQIAPGQLQVIMQEAGVAFDHCVDGVAYLRGDQIVTLAPVLKGVRDEINAALDSAASN
ncbi:MAG: hypothetical protein IT424_02720 [Pirellulales bacterium]|nr:hypothetical protein [Pirellulales bacterium]